MRELQNVAQLFDGIAEGEGLTYAEMFYIAKRSGGNGTAAEFGRRAVELLRGSEKHEQVVAEIQQHIA
jgi:hypothetical protein